MKAVDALGIANIRALGDRDVHRTSLAAPFAVYTVLWITLDGDQPRETGKTKPNSLSASIIAVWALTKQ